MSVDQGGRGAPCWWSHPDGPTGRGPGFRLPPGRVAPLGLAAAAPVPAAVPPTRRESRTGLRLAVLGVLAVLCSGLLGGGVGAVVQGTRQGGRITLHQATEVGLESSPGPTAVLVKEALPGVVYLSVVVDGSETTGTGIVLDGAGHILTNNHVVAPKGTPGETTVTFSTGQRHPAALVGRDVDSDLAVIQVRGVSGLRPLALGSTDRLEVGDPVVAIGAPFGLLGTVTSGIVSARDRPLTSGSTNDGAGLAHLDALQTDAPINPGNSGGPLLDAAGTVVGVNTVIRSAGADDTDPFSAQDASGSIGLGFAIPVDQALRVAEQLINVGRASHTTIGSTLDLTYQGAAQITATSRATRSGSSASAAAGAPAAGPRPGDLVTAVDGTPVTSGDELVSLIRGRRPGDTVILSVERGDTALELPVLLRSAAGPAAADSA